MKRRGWQTAAVTLGFLAGMTLLVSCSSNSGSPTGPTGIGQGKALYRGVVVEAGVPVAGARIVVNEADTGIVSGADGSFEVTLQPGDAYTVKALVACVDLICPTDPLDPAYDPDCVDVPCTEPDVVVWSDSVVVTPGNEIDPVEPEVVSNGIGECVSECVHLYKPGSGVPPEDLISLGATKNGNFNATPCVQFCKENFRGVALPGDSNCNPFHLKYPVCNGEPDDPGDPGEPVDPVEAAEADDGPKPKKPKKPKSNNGKGNGNA